MLFEDAGDKKLIVMGLKIDMMRRLHNNIDNFLFTVTDRGTMNEHVVENFEGSQEILDVINGYIRGESADSIGESIFQSDGEPVKKILSLFGIQIK